MNFNGSLDFISEWGKGSTFIFTFDVEIDEDAQQISQVLHQISPRFADTEIDLQLGDGARTIQDVQYVFHNASNIHIGDIVKN